MGTLSKRIAELWTWQTCAGVSAARNETRAGGDNGAASRSLKAFHIRLA
jgi:hypothetical protein